MSTPMPSFPIDIFAHIIDIIAKRRSTQDDRPPLACLKHLSLVCKTFAELSQRHLFRRIGFTGSSGAGVLEGVLWISKHAPHIRLYVQELRIDFTKYEDGTIPNATLRCASTQLARFPNLQVLALLYKVSASSTASQSSDTIDPVISLLHYLIDDYVSQENLCTLAIDTVPHVSVSTIVRFMAGRSSRKLFYKGTGMNVFSEFYPVSRITELVVSVVPSFDLSVLSYLPELVSLELACLKPILDNVYAIDSLSLNLEHLALGFPEPGQAAFVINLYKRYGATTGVAAFGKLTSLKYFFVDRSDVLAFNEILSDVPPLHSLHLFAHKYTEPVFPMDIIDIDGYFQHSSRPLTSLFLWHHAIPTTEANFRASLAGLHNFLSAMAMRNVLQDFTYKFSAEADRLSLPPSGPWHDIGDILAPISHFPDLRCVEVTLNFEVDPDTLMVLHKEKTYNDNFYIRGALMDLGDRLGSSLLTWMLFLIPPEDS